MGSVKHLITDPSKGEGIAYQRAAELYEQPTRTEFGMGVWWVAGTSSVGDLKEVIPSQEIDIKGPALTMMTALFFEKLAEKHPEIPTCYLGLLDKDGKEVSAQQLIDRGDTTNIILMRLAHTPQSYSGGDIGAYRASLDTMFGELKCGVADVESIFRNGFPLGSSTFKKIFNAVGLGSQYNYLATYQETVEALDSLRDFVEEKGLDNFPELQRVLIKYGLGETIPNPGFVLHHPVYDTTTKFEAAGDRDIYEEEAMHLSGLTPEGYGLWTGEFLPNIVQAQIELAMLSNIINIDGKLECVAYHGEPVLTDFAFTPDENRLMIVTGEGKERIAIPTNKEIMRAIFRENGIFVVIEEAKAKAATAGKLDSWREFVPGLLQRKRINIKGVTEHAYGLMRNAIGEVANRVFDHTVFDVSPLETWVDDFKPYASRLNM